MGAFDASARPDLDRFAAEALGIARRTPAVADARYDRAQFAVIAWPVGQREPIWVYLSNVYRDCAGAGPEERHEALTRLFHAMLAPPTPRDWDEVRPRLRPVLRPATFAQAPTPGIRPPLCRPALPYLSEFVVIDQPESMAYVGPDSLDEWGLEPADVFAVARENMAAAAEHSLTTDWAEPGALFRLVEDGDTYVGSLPLVPGWLAEVSRRMGGQAIAFLPDTGSALLCAVRPGHLDAIYEMVEEDYRNATRPLSPVGYVSDEAGRVVPYRPPAGHPDHLAARRAEVVLATTEYEAQATWLTGLYQENGVDVHVAKLMAVAEPGRPPFTLAVWSDGVTGLLPEADHIAFMGSGGRGPTVPWRVVAELVELWPEPLLEPPRYRVDDWPSPEVMDELRRRSRE
jgi:hypothetical protein